MPPLAATAQPAEGQPLGVVAASPMWAFHPNFLALLLAASMLASPLVFASCKKMMSAAVAGRTCSSAVVKQLGLLVSSAQRPSVFHPTSSCDVCGGKHGRTLDLLAAAALVRFTLVLAAWQPLPRCAAASSSP